MEPEVCPKVVVVCSWQGSKEHHPTKDPNLCALFCRDARNRHQSQVLARLLNTWIDLLELKLKPNGKLQKFPHFHTNTPFDTASLHGPKPPWLRSPCKTSCMLGAKPPFLARCKMPFSRTWGDKGLWGTGVCRGGSQLRGLLKQALDAAV